MNDGTRPDVSVIIPTCGRPLSLRRSLDALARQLLPGRSFQVIVVADGDERVAEEARQAVPKGEMPPMQVIGLGRQRGAAAARNAGATAAAAPLLVFLDDDVVASPRLIASHLDAHAGSRGSTSPRAVVGYLSTDVQGGDFFDIALRGWWEAMFEGMRARGHRVTYRDLLTGNLSIPAAAFRSVGGFDEALRCHEDFEFGARLLAAGIDVAFSDAAAGVHDERTGLDRSLGRKRAEGAADVQILRRHPHLLLSLPLGWFDVHAPRRQHWLRALAFRFPSLAAGAARAMRAALGWLEGARLRGRWQHLLDDLLTLHYWFGVLEVLPARAQVEALRVECMAARPPDDTMTLDISSGAREPLWRLVDERRPRSLRVRCDGAVVGEIPDRPGSERLRGVHLQRALCDELAAPLLRVLDARGVIRVTVSPGGAVKTRSVPVASLALGRPS